MDKTRRLFSIMDSFRRHRRPITATELAKEQRVSVRTLYRDVQTLIELGAPIEGEAGFGYVLKPGFFLPPLMFTPEELEALVLGARWVQHRPDAALAGAAKNALGKIEAAAPDALREELRTSGLWAVPSVWEQKMEPLLGVIRESMRSERALHITYEDERGRLSERPVWAVGLAYYEEKHIVGAWCTLRQGFRNFRVDRIRSARQGTERFGRRRSILMREWEETWEARRPRDG